MSESLKCPLSTWSKIDEKNIRPAGLGHFKIKFQYFKKNLNFKFKF